jgi:ribokinase
MTEAVASYPLHLVRWLILNETEAAALTGESEPEKSAELLCRRYPGLELVLTLGSDGALYRKDDFTLFIPARRAEAVDATGAGDVFVGYFLSAVADGADPGYSLTLAAAAAALSVARPGAADSVPSLEEVLQTL